VGSEKRTIKEENERKKERKESEEGGDRNRTYSNDNGGRD